jgi:chorismate lyase
LKLDWQNKESALKVITDKRAHPFLFNEGSLTQFIQQRCPGLFSVELISESWHQPLADEAELLSLENNENTFIRKSLLKCDNQILVYARTAIPEKTLSGKNQKLTELGEKPLGDVLFNDKTTYRSDIRYAKIPVNCELHKEATKGSDITSELWVRQSLIYIEQQPLLITEIFLPAILECSQN